ncbi:hypothetical protein HPB47_002580 [Ixodes persulcatus]|uniref:Uncharacterized protein n=1 Tax=Ixodes persulcatus TaxID=34615 RepID=A0AC60PKY7_IXOPE|nr:hypothetical protein HPB47_002580 [Ixodes persulcatus]
MGLRAGRPSKKRDRPFAHLSRPPSAVRLPALFLRQAVHDRRHDHGDPLIPSRRCSGEPSPAVPSRPASSGHRRRRRAASPRVQRDGRTGRRRASRILGNPSSSSSSCPANREPHDYVCIESERFSRRSPYPSLGNWIPPSRRRVGAACRWRLRAATNRM